MLDILIIALALLALSAGSLTDLKTREVPDWVNYGLLFTALGLRVIAGVISQDFTIILEGIYGFGIFFALGSALFYLGQFGGGDAKMLMSLGLLIGFTPEWTSTIAMFTVAILLVGAIYGLFWSMGLAIVHHKSFLIAWKKLQKRKSVILIKILLAIMFISLIMSFVFLQITQTLVLIITLFVTVGVTTYLWLFVKAVESSVMLKEIPPEKLTEGDWISKDVFYKGEYICGPKDLGIEKKQIQTLLRLKKQRKIKTVLVKEGIPFIPSFLIAYCVTLIVHHLFF